MTIDIDFKSPQFLPTANFKAGEKTNLIGLSYAELEQEIIKIGGKKFTAKQIWNWIYSKGIKNFSEMSNIARETREKLTENYSIKRPEISQDLISTDGTRKWLIKFSDCREAEMVYIPEGERGTLCISSQIGCTLTCKFCHTGTQLLVRNLSAGEIVAQLILARDLLNDWSKTSLKQEMGVQSSPYLGGASLRQQTMGVQSSPYLGGASLRQQTMRVQSSPYLGGASLRQQTMGVQNKRQITSIVFMGMGEPFFNYDQVKKAVEILNDDNGINFSKRKITISTSGVVPEIMRFTDEIKTVLAISLHATNDELRSKIMPLNKKYPLQDLMKACKYYTDQTNSRITFEYVMLKDTNDSDIDSRNLVKLLKTYQLPALINLIPFNPWAGSDFLCSSRNRIMAFGKIIKDAGYTVTIRKTKGQDVMAACGQLKSASQRERKVPH